MRHSVKIEPIRGQLFDCRDRGNVKRQKTLSRCIASSCNVPLGMHLELASELGGMHPGGTVGEGMVEQAKCRKVVLV